MHIIVEIFHLHFDLEAKKNLLKHVKWIKIEKLKNDIEY